MRKRRFGSAEVPVIGQGTWKLRRFAIECLAAGAPWVVAGVGGAEPALVIARAKTAGGDLRALLPELLERARGKGGGSADFLQTAPADAAAAESAWGWAREVVGQLLAMPGAPTPPA